MYMLILELDLDINKEYIMNQVQQSKDLFSYHIDQKYYKNIFIIFSVFMIIINLISISNSYNISAFIPNEVGEFNTIARIVHFIALATRFMFGILLSLILFSHMFGSQLSSVIKRLRKNPLAILGLCIILTLTVLAIFADFIANYELVVIKQNLSNTFSKPGYSTLLGTDEFGRDIFARIVHGTRISLSIGFVAVSISIVLGGFLGALAGYFGGWLDNIIMRIMDVFLAIPSILLSIAVVSALGPSLVNLVIAISISSVPVYARIVRASVLSISGQEFIEAAHAIGANHIYIIIKHIIPNVMSPIIVQGTLGVAGAILSIAGLSFIGLGVQPPTPEWGSMLAGGRSFIRRASWVTTYPGVAIMITILSLNLLGDGLRDALDPKLK